jgi:hypothetical protein
VSPFAPVGQQARWKTIYDLLATKKVDEIVTYEALADDLGLDPIDDRPAIQMAMRQAVIKFEEDDKHTVESVRNVGYRVVQPTEHMRLARHHGRKARRQIESAYSKAINVDMTGMDLEVRKAFETLALGFAHQLEVNRRQEVNNRRMQKALDSVSSRVELTEEEIGSLARRMAALEQKLGSP